MGRFFEILNPFGRSLSLNKESQCFWQPISIAMNRPKLKKAAYFYSLVGEVPFKTCCFGSSLTAICIISVIVGRRSQQNVYAFVYFGTHLLTFSAAMYTFASLKGILGHPAAEVCRWWIFQKREPGSLSASCNLPTSVEEILYRNEQARIEKGYPLLLILTHCYSFFINPTHFCVLANFRNVKPGVKSISAKTKSQNSKKRVV